MGADQHPPNTCPRRMSEFGPWEYKSGLDKPEQRGSEPFHRCSFCGSIMPQDVLRFLREGVKVQATNKAYKVYLDIPTQEGAAKVYMQHFTREEVAEANAIMQARNAQVP